MKLFDSLSSSTIQIRPKRYRALASRIGIFPYMINGKLQWLYRPEEEVFNPDSVDSFLDAMITIGHPYPQESLSDQQGMIYSVDVIRDSTDIENGIYCDYVTFTEEADTLSKSGSPTSPMYDAVIKDSTGEFNGKRYDYIQTDIVYSSLGLVNNARQEKTKVYYQLSKDHSINNDLLSSESVNVIEIPVIDMKVKSLVPPKVESVVGDVDESKIQDSPEELVIEENKKEEPEKTEEDNSESNVESEKLSDNFDVNEDNGINFKEEYLRSVVECAARLADMGIEGIDFEKALLYGFSKLANIQKIILENKGVKLGDSDDVGVTAAYKVYISLENAKDKESDINSSDSKQKLSDSSVTQNKKTVKSFSPSKVNHPLHNRGKNNSTKKTTSKTSELTFDDLE